MHVTKKKNVPRSGDRNGSMYSFVSLTIFAELGARNFRDVLNNIYSTAINLPKPIRRVCYVQLVAFLAWSVIHILCFKSNILMFCFSL